jgi:hypothetical protein
MQRKLPHLKSAVSLVTASTVLYFSVVSRLRRPFLSLISLSGCVCSGRRAAQPTSAHIANNATFTPREPGSTSESLGVSLETGEEGISASVMDVNAIVAVAGLAQMLAWWHLRPRAARRFTLLARNRRAENHLP